MMLHLVPLLAENSLFKAVGDIFHPLFIAIAAVLAWIYGIVPDYTASIVILTLLIMGLLTPLTIKSTRSMLAMQALNPEMQKLRAKYKGAENREQLNQEMMRLYRENGVSPTGGCLPMFLQMPALIVLYDTIRGLANTVKRGQKYDTNHKVCHATVCATPHYVPRDSAIFHNLVRAHGAMHSIGLNLAARPLTHRATWYDYIPYFALLAVAVGLQYFQMAQMTKRNKRNNTQQQVPQQMQTMQRVMPLIFAYIYFLVPAGVVIYMIVSSAVRVLTQDLIFRYGLVPSPGSREVGGGKPPRQKPTPDDGGPKPVPAGGPKGGPKGTGGAAPPRAGPSQRRGRFNGSGSGNTNGSTVPKQHPRSKSKRERKAR
jgi:YidC/Oxa1 family membrane protein insertase